MAKRFKAWVNSPNVMRPLSCKSNAARQAPNTEPKRLMRFCLKPSKLSSPCANFVTLFLAISTSETCRRLSSCLHKSFLLVRCSPSTVHLCIKMSDGQGNSSPMPLTSSTNSVSALLIKPLTSEVTQRLCASGSKSANVMPMPRGHVLNMLKSFLLSKLKPRRSQQSLISCSSIRPVPLISRPLRQAVNMSPYLYIKFSLNVPTVSPTSGSISPTETTPFLLASNSAHNCFKLPWKPILRQAVQNS
mmetsp:Transcript_24913/g.83085  ORF Transcript_24913/g.83085 Transcript_24913/m.83085 type:complete len:246 (+) Transcript_24913:2465-3202(+)